MKYGFLEVGAFQRFSKVPTLRGVGRKLNNN